MRFEWYTRGRVLTCIALVAVIAVAFLVTSEPVLAQGAKKSPVMQIHYLEFVTKEVDAVCRSYAAAFGVKFSEPIAGFGNARTTKLPGGGMLGVRAPLRETEEPVVRPYWLVDDIKAVVAAAVKAGGEVAHPPMEIPVHGTFAIYIKGGINHGLWQR